MLDVLDFISSLFLLISLLSTSLRTLVLRTYRGFSGLWICENQNKTRQDTSIWRFSFFSSSSSFPSSEAIWLFLSALGFMAFFFLLIQSEPLGCLVFLLGLGFHLFFFCLSICIISVGTIWTQGNCCSVIFLFFLYSSLRLFASGWTQKPSKN